MKFFLLERKKLFYFSYEKSQQCVKETSVEEKGALIWIVREQSKRQRKKVRFKIKIKEIEERNLTKRKNTVFPVIPFVTYLNLDTWKNFVMLGF